MRLNLDIHGHAPYHRTAALRCGEPEDLLAPGLGPLDGHVIDGTRHAQGCNFLIIGYHRDGARVLGQGNDRGRVEALAAWMRRTIEGYRRIGVERAGGGNG